MISVSSGYASATRWRYSGIAKLMSGPMTWLLVTTTGTPCSSAAS